MAAAMVNKVTAEARIALMNEKNLTKDLMEEILSWIPIDKNSKSPMADLFRAQVSVVAIDDDDDDPDVVLLIGTHNHRFGFSDYQWYTKEHECLRYSDTIEEKVIFNKLKNIMIEVKTYDTFDCPKFKLILYMVENLDVIIWHAYIDTIVRVFENDRSRFYRLLTESDEEHEQLVNEHNEYWADRRPAEISDDERCSEGSGDEEESD